MFAMCLSAVLIMAALSFLGFFEFGTTYTLIVLIAGIVVTISPTVLIKFLSDDFMKYYMLIMLSLFIGVLGTSNHIGIYMTYALAPLFSCLYFDPKFTAKMSIFSYIVMAAALYFNCKGKYEVVYQGRSHIAIYAAYLIGFTIEYAVVNN